MVTHQALSGSTDEEFLQRMASTYGERFGKDFWEFFTAHVAPSMPPRPVIIDLGCGPGLLLRDLGERYPQATLYGYDVTPAMIAHGQQLTVTGAKPTLALHDVGTQPLPNAPGSVHLVSMTSVLHIIDDPLTVLAEIRRVLAPGGIFMLHDWIRMPLKTYLERRRENMGEDETESRRRGFRVFPMHCKYTTEDWQWILAQAGLAIRYQTQLRPTHQMFVTTPG
jgi:SAM-dependent methyltransferase